MAHGPVDNAWHFVDGKWVAASSDELLDSVNPSTGKLLYLIVNPAIAKGGILGGVGVERG